MAVISGGRYARGIQKALAIKGETVIPDLDSALQAGIDLGSLEDHMDTRILFGWRSYSARPAAAAVANQNSFVAFVNPSNSGVIAVLDKLVAWELSTFDLMIQVSRGTPGAITSPGVVRDSRGATGTAFSNSVCGGLNGNNATPQNVYAFVPPTLLAATIVRYDVIADERESIVVLPNEGVYVWSNSAPAAGVVLNGWFEWRERALDPSEATA